MNIIQSIFQNSQAHPERTAMISESESITYDCLWKKSEALSKYLDTISQDKKPVVVYGHKSVLMPVCFLSCLKTGRAYIPVDMSVPYSRVLDIIADSGCDIILATEPLDYPNGVITRDEIVCAVEKYSGEHSDPQKWVSGDDLFYVLFTSGSTGRPKGVQITHDCVANFLDWSLTLGGFSKDGKIFVNQAPFSFDLSVYELYMSLVGCGTLFSLTKKLMSSMKLLFEALGNSGADIWVSTPSFAEMCLADKAFCAELLPQMKLFLFCGETLCNSTVTKLHERFSSATVINTYGPTESTVAVTDVTVTPEMNSSVSPLPVGRAKPGTKIIIADAAHKPVKNGEKGEIIIVGNTVSSGYFANPEMTAKAFGTWDSERCYYTGDEGYLSGDMLYYCGRIDLQLKLNGYRIELEDIENNIQKLPYVRSAVVVPVVKEGKVHSLTCFAVLTERVADSDFACGMAIKNALKETLPSYMIPKKVIIRDSIPMTPNGKADRKALRAEL